MTVGEVTYRQNLDLVPWRHTGQLPAVRVTEDAVIAWGAPSVAAAAGD